MSNQNLGWSDKLSDHVFEIIMNSKLTCMCSYFRKRVLLSDRQKLSGSSLPSKVVGIESTWDKSPSLSEPGKFEILVYQCIMNDELFI